MLLQTLLHIQDVLHFKLQLLALPLETLVYHKHIVLLMNRKLPVIKERMAYVGGQHLYLQPYQHHFADLNNAQIYY